MVRSAGRVKTTPAALEVLGASLEPTDRVALEVSACSWEVARILEPHVQRVIVVSPDDTRIAQPRTKTDKLDARALAKLLWQGELDAVWMPDKRCRVLRRVTLLAWGLAKRVAKLARADPIESRL